MVRVIDPSVSILYPDEQEPDVLKRLEEYGRTAYKSEDKITPDSAERFIEKIIRNGHESVLEHVSITVRFICDRGVTHELVRHRIAAYTQESTRYCNYGQTGITVIKPCFWRDEPFNYDCWRQAMEMAEKAYQYLIDNGATPQQARSVLPNSLKTEIITTMNIREWRHVFKLRTAPAAHPQMQQVMRMLLDQMKDRFPVLFYDID